MEQFDLDAPLFKLGSGEFSFTHRMACEGLGVFGGIGSGKTSGSGKLIMERFISAGYGGLVCTVKDDVDMWKSACEKAGRLHDLLIIEPGGHRFNFLQYISTDSDQSKGYTENVVEVLKTVLNAGEMKDHGKGQDPFWERALDMLIFNAIDLCKFAYGDVDLQQLYDIIQTVPKSKEALKSRTPEEEQKAFHKAMRTAFEKLQKLIDAWEQNLSEAEKQVIIKHPDAYEKLQNLALPEVRLVRQIDQFFIDSLITLHEKTRSTVDFNVTGFIFQLLRDPIYSTFCQGKSTVTPEDSLDGKIILLNFPIKKWNKVGRDCQILFKYIWQKAMEKRDISKNGRPVFLWADEAQHIIHEHDTSYQATARSSRIATVYISQNLPNYFASMGTGGDRSKYLVQSFLGTLATKIFHANADVETNKYASELIGQQYYIDEGESITRSGDLSVSENRKLILQAAVRPEQFIGLKTGGPQNSFCVEGYLHRQGNRIYKNRNYLKVNFLQ